MFSNQCNKFHGAILHTQNRPFPTIYLFPFCNSTLPTVYLFQKENWALYGKVQSNNNITVTAVYGSVMSLGLQQTGISGD